MDSYRPRRDEPARLAFQFGRDGRQETGRDSYRPGDFSFRARNANVPNFSVQPASGPGRQSRRQPRRHDRPYATSDSRPEVRRGAFHGNRRQFQPRPKIPVAERPLLRGGRSATPEQYEGMNGGPARFKDLQELESESDSVNTKPSDSEGPPRKRLTAATGSTVPKWSNPDPYTALPPPEQSTGVRTDVVSLIRKARSDAAKDRLAAGVGEDFISFDVDEDESSDSDSDDNATHAPSVGDSEGRRIPQRFSHLDNLHPDRFAPGTDDAINSIDALGPPPPPPPGLVLTSRDKGPPRSALNGAPIDVWPPPPPSSIPNNDKYNSVGRKRNREAIVDRFDVADDLQAARQPHTKRKPAPPGFPTDSKWMPCASENATPWCTVDHSDTMHVGQRLHKEICDFYEYVKPHDWEHDMRKALIRRTAQFVQSVLGTGAELRYFGSFAAGVYLPNADMDLVVLSRDFRERRTRAYGAKSMVHNFANALRNRADSVAKVRSVAAIAGAKVPIVKYVDRLTGIRVDVSFDNDTGVIANHTYAQWKAQYPCMPVLVTLVKQFLQMRDLNDVSTGGLGGFSTACLVVSLLQHLPHVQSGDMAQTVNLGELFMTFLDFYGNKFNLQTTGIQLNPPGYFVKHKNRNIKLKRDKPFGLCVIDPNRDDNDLTGGTRHSKMIFDCFAHGFAMLQDRMAEIKGGDKSKRLGSVLACLFAGSYLPFETQRAQLRQLSAEQER